MKATKAKSRAAAKARTRRPSAAVAARIEKAAEKLLDETAPVDGTEGDVQFDDANTYNCSRCVADNGRGINTVEVGIEIYPEPPGAAAEGNHESNVQIFIRRGQAHLVHETDDLQLNWRELEPFAVALRRAVANAKARGFLPATGAAA